MEDKDRRDHLRLIALVVAVLLLSACASQPWKQDPAVQAARRDCADLPQGERYACIERNAVTSLNPDVCRLAGMWVDDMCLQAVYEAANDPAICDRLYLEGVRPTCRAYYAARSRPTLVAPPVLTPWPEILSELTPVSVPSVEEAQALLSFPLLVPDTTTLPSGLAFADAQVFLAGEHKAVALMYQGDDLDLTVQQLILPAPLAPPDQPHEPVMVRGRTGHLITLPSAPNLYALLWEEDGQAIALSGNLSPEVLMQIADGLRPLNQTLIAPGTTADIDCADVAPFAPGCLDQPRPPGLAPDVSFVGILPAGPVRVAAWSPDGTHLAYAVANPETGAFQGLEVRSLPDFRLEGRWSVRGIFDLTWTPDGQAILFIFNRDDTSSIGLARLGEVEWRDLLPGGKAVLAVSMGKNFVDWLGEDVLAFRVHCGTGCETLYSLDIVTGELHPLVNAWGEPEAPYADVFATVYLFSPDQRWLAATSWGRGLPEAVVLEWPGPAEPVDLSARLDNRYTEAQPWMGDSLAFVTYPPGDPDKWSLPLHPDLYIWDGDTEVMRRLASGAFRAAFSPNDDRLAVLFVGEPRANEKGEIETEGSKPYLGLLDWPAGRLLATHPVSTKGISDPFDLWRLPTPIWARLGSAGSALAFQPAEGGLALMDEDGDVWPILTGKVVNWVDWGGGHLGLLLDEEIWLVRGSVREPTSGTRPYTDAVLGIALDISAKWEVYGFQGAEAHIVALDTIGRPQGVLTFSVFGAFDTLDSTLEEVKRGAWGPHIREVQPVRLGEFEALRLELTPGEDRPPVVWLVVTPSAIAVAFTPDNDLALAESVLATLRVVPVREPWEAITPTPSTADVVSAREALIAFFSLLHAQRYREAANYHGGTYDILRDWNPDVNEDDYATLFQRGCTSNGLKCLKIRTIVREEQVSPTEFSFIVEFINDDGTLFVRGPCCGTEEQKPPQAQFCSTVKKVGDRFLVQHLPVYVP